MPKTNKLLMLATATATAATVATPLLAADAVPLIERAKLFGNPTKTGGQVSPDGRWISFIAPRDGVLNVWVAPAATPDQVDRPAAVLAVPFVAWLYFATLPVEQIWQRNAATTDAA